MACEICGLGGLFIKSIQKLDGTDIFGDAGVVDGGASFLVFQISLCPVLEQFSHNLGVPVMGSYHERSDSTVVRQIRIGIRIQQVDNPSKDPRGKPRGI